MGITPQQLDQAFEEYKRKYGGLKEDYFALLYLGSQYGGDPETYVNQVAFGNYDFGIDAFHFDRERRNLYLMQFKWSESHATFKDSLDRLIKAGMEQIFGDSLQDNRKNDFLLQLGNALDENRAIIERVYIQFIFNGDPAAAENSTVLDAQRELLESKKHLIDTFFGRENVTLSVQFLSNETRRVGAASRTRKTHRYELPLDEVSTHRLANGTTMFVGFLPLVRLHKIFLEMGPRLFDRNIRFGLSGERAPNRAMKRSLLSIATGSCDPGIFSFHHNGITISAEHFEMQDGIARVTEPRVLNGAQTVTSVHEFFEEQRDHPAVQQNRDRLDQVQVLARVIVSADDNFLVNVTISNNKQNPVAPWNLRASDRIQLELQDKFREDLKIFYERQESSFGAMTDSELEEKGIEHAKAIEIKRLAQTFLAVQGEIDRVSRLPEVFENDSFYETAFKESFLNANSNYILLGYKIQFRLRNINDQIFGGMAKYAYMRRAQNLLWALLIQALLNDRRIGHYAEEFGQSLVMETDYTELLKKLATKYVKPIVQQAISEDNRREAIDEGKVGFLRSKAFYQECMRIAYDRFAWKRKSF